MSLATLAQKGSLQSGDSLADSTNQLVSDAPPEVAEAIERGEQHTLVYLKNLIDNRLAVLGDKQRATLTSVDADHSVIATVEDTTHDENERRNGALVNGDRMPVVTTKLDAAAIADADPAADANGQNDYWSSEYDEDEEPVYAYDYQDYGDSDDSDYSIDDHINGNDAGAGAGDSAMDVDP